MKKWLLLPVLVLLVSPAVAWAAFKPERLLAPTLNGVSCPSQSICVDDAARYARASQLYSQALQFVDANVGRLAERPRVVFCVTEACFQSFGFKRASGQTVGTLGIVISPHGWKPYYIRHEMIHYLQHERLGSLKCLLVTPRWFLEGMAYSLSQDPRPNLGTPWQQDRARFNVWYAKVGKQNLWTAAARL